MEMFYHLSQPDPEPSAPDPPQADGNSFWDNWGGCFGGNGDAEDEDDGYLFSEVNPLSQGEINERIEAPEESLLHRVKSAGFTVHYAWLSQRGYYPDDMTKKNQDAFKVVPSFGGDPNRMLLAVYDGHGTAGEDVSYFVRDHVVDTMTTMVKRYPKDLAKAHKMTYMQMNQRIHANRLGARGAGFDELRSHAFFQPLDLAALAAGELPAPHARTCAAAYKQKLADEGSKQEATMVLDPGANSFTGDESWCAGFDSIGNSSWSQKLLPTYGSSEHMSFNNAKGARNSYTFQQEGVSVITRADGSVLGGPGDMMPMRRRTFTAEVSPADQVRNSVGNPSFEKASRKKSFLGRVSNTMFNREPTRDKGSDKKPPSMV